MLPRATESPLEALAWIAARRRASTWPSSTCSMPEMDGVTLARAMREQPAGATLPLVLFTSLGRREAGRTTEGFAAYLHKPIKPSQLFDTLIVGARPSATARVARARRRPQRARSRHGRGASRCASSSPRTTW